MEVTLSYSCQTSAFRLFLLSLCLFSTLGHLIQFWCPEMISQQCQANKYFTGPSQAFAPVKSAKTLTLKSPAWKEQKVLKENSSFNVCSVVAVWLSILSSPRCFLKLRLLWVDRKAADADLSILFCTFFVLKPNHWPFQNELFPLGKAEFVGFNNGVLPPGVKAGSA